MTLLPPGANPPDELYVYPPRICPCAGLALPGREDVVPGWPGQDGALPDAIGTKRDETYLNPEKQECTRPKVWCVALTVRPQSMPGPGRCDASGCAV